MAKTEKRRNRKKRIAAIVLAIVLFFAVVAGGLQIGCVVAEKTWVHWRPGYAKTDITAILRKEEKTEDDYAILYAQTGLTKLGVDDLLAEADLDKILTIQDFYFRKNPVYSDNFAPFTYTEKTREQAELTTLKNGDILVSARMRVSFLRFGHSALVIDGENGMVVEAVSPGAVSEFASVNTFLESASFMVLRPKTDAATREAVAAFAKQRLVNIPYKVTTGIFTKKYDPNTIKASHCSHLVWYAYKKFGIDLDSTGGLVVTPRDMARSDKVEVVQIYGFHPQKLWN